MGQKGRKNIKKPKTKGKKEDKAMKRVRP